MKKSNSNSIKSLLTILFLLTNFCFVASAQNITSISRIVVTTADAKTNISVNNFPANTSIVVMDPNYNLLAVATTNNEGSAFIKLPTGQTRVIVKTVNGEITVSNKPVIKSNNQEQNIAAAKSLNQIKA